MPTTYTRKQIRQEVLNRWGELGYFATADSVQTTSITDASEFAHTGYQDDEFKDYWLYRPNLSGNDQLKRVGPSASLNNVTGVLTHDSVVYVDTTDLEYELWGPDPRWINQAIAIAQRKRYIRSLWFLARALDAAGNAADMDMETTGVAMWDGSTAGQISNATPTKVTTAGNVYSGTQALRVLLSGANGYVRSAIFRVDSGRQLYTAIIARADVGTVTLKLYDVTNAAYITNAGEPSYSGEQFAAMERIDQVPSGCEEVRVEIRGTGATDDIYVDCINGPWVLGTRRIQLPTWMNEQYKIRYMRPSLYQIAIESGNRVWDADSRYFTGDWQNPQDFTIEAFHRDVNGYHLNLNRDFEFDGPMWLSVERSREALEPLNTETGTTTETVDGFEELMAEVLHQVAVILAGASQGPAQEAKWTQRAAEYLKAEQNEIVSRPPPAKTVPRGVFNIRA